MLKFVLGSIAMLSIIVGTVWGWFALGIITTAVFLFTLAFYLKKEGHVVVPELTTAVVYRTKGQAFSHFLEPGQHWINPAKEHIEAYITTAGQSTSAKTAGIQAIGGLNLAVEWTLAYSIIPTKVSPDSRAKMARALPHKAAAIARQQINNCLHHVIGDYTLEQLCEPSAHRKLERAVRQLAYTRLAPLGFNISRLMIDAVHMPKHVLSALEAAHEREMHAEKEARALEKLQKVISRFSKDDMERLIELERIHMMGKHGFTVMYPTAESRIPHRPTITIPG